MNKYLKCPTCGYSYVEGYVHKCPPLYRVVGVDEVPPSDEVEALIVKMRSLEVFGVFSYSNRSQNAIAAALEYKEEKVQVVEFIEEEVVAVLNDETGEIVFFNVVAEYTVEYDVSEAVRQDDVR